MRAGHPGGHRASARSASTSRRMQAFITKMRSEGLTNALQERDAPFGDYRTTT